MWAARAAAQRVARALEHSGRQRTWPAFSTQFARLSESPDAAGCFLDALDETHHANSSKPASWDSFNYYSNTRNSPVSYLKALYGDAPRNEQLGVRLICLK